MLSEVVPGIGIEEVDGDNAQGQRDQRNCRQRLPKVTFLRCALDHASGSAAFSLRAVIPKRTGFYFIFCRRAGERVAKLLCRADFVKEENSDGLQVLRRVIICLFDL